MHGKLYMTHELLVTLFHVFLLKKALISKFNNTVKRILESDYYGAASVCYHNFRDVLSFLTNIKQIWQCILFGPILFLVTRRLKRNLSVKYVKQEIQR
jgi:hypothetical protein